MLHIKDIAIDWGKAGMIMVISQWLSGVSLMDSSWQISTLFTLLGFAAYHLGTRNIPTPTFKGNTQTVVDDWIKFGTVLIVSRMLSGGGLGDGTWIRSSLATLAGFAVYNIIISNHIQGNQLTYNKKLQDVINDWAKYGTKLIVSHVLSCQPMFAQSWIINVFGTLIGLTAYNLGISHIIDAVFDI